MAKFKEEKRGEREENWNENENESSLRIEEVRARGSILRDQTS